MQPEAGEKRCDAGLWLVGDDPPRGHGEVDPQLEGSAAAPLPFSRIRTHSSLSMCKVPKQGTKTCRHVKCKRVQEPNLCGSCLEWLSEDGQRGEEALRPKPGRHSALGH